MTRTACSSVQWKGKSDLGLGVQWRKGSLPSQAQGFLLHKAYSQLPSAWLPRKTWAPSPLTFLGKVAERIASSSVQKRLFLLPTGLASEPAMPG